jgi:hypothetical protein
MEILSASEARAKDITGATGLTEAQKSSLKALGAVELEK